MVKSDRSNFWFVRSDGPESFLRQKCGELATQLDVKAIIAVYHEGGSKENPHMHACVELTSDPQKQSFDVRIKKLFEITKRSAYSTKKWDGIRDGGASSYLFHEETAEYVSPILTCKGWSDDDVALLRQTNKAVQKANEVNKARAGTRLPGQALEHFAGQKPCKLEILKYMLRQIRTGDKYHPGEYQLKKFVEEVELKLLDEEDMEMYSRDVYSRLWR